MVKNNFNKNIPPIQIISLIFFLLVMTLISTSPIIIPFQYLPHNIQSNDSPKEIFSSYLTEKIYLNITIGTPPQIVQIPLNFDEHVFYITQSSSAIDKNSSYYQNYLIFNETKSNTYKIINQNDFNSYSNDYNIIFGSNSTDVFYFYDSLKFNSKKKINISFIFSMACTNPISGGFGLQIFDWKGSNENFIPSSLETLKNQKIINDYIFSIHFNNKNNNKGDGGFILLDNYPHDMKKKLGIHENFEFDKNNYKEANDIKQDKTFGYELNMDKVLFYVKNSKKNRKYNIYFNKLQNDDLIKEIQSENSLLNKIKLDYNLGGIYIPKYYYSYLIEKVFSIYFDEVNSCVQDYLNSQFYSFVYCKNKKSIIKKIKSKIPTIIFNHPVLNYNFTLNVNDLIYKTEDYVFFLFIYYKSQSKSWTLGKPFLKKYPFVFNPYKKQIGFYSSFYLTGVKYSTLFKIVVCIMILFILAGVLFGRYKYKEKKIAKMRALELVDNSYSNFNNSNSSINSKGIKFYQSY